VIPETLRPLARRTFEIARSGIVGNKVHIDLEIADPRRQLLRVGGRIVHVPEQHVFEGNAIP